LQLKNIVEDIRALVADKDRTHTEILEQMREDRKATDRRLRWLELNVWSRRRRNDDVS
jgi:hypothetical protein